MSRPGKKITRKTINMNNKVVLTIFNMDKMTKRTINMNNKVVLTTFNIEKDEL